MRPEELFVGAIVSNTNGNVGKVIGIRPYMGTAPSMKTSYEIVTQYHQTGTAFTDPSLLVPIDLTTDLLEQNGWETKDKIVWYKKGPIRLGWYPSNKSLITGYYTFPQAVCYVHQLMAIQRLLGLEEIKI